MQRGRVPCGPSQFIHPLVKACRYRRLMSQTLGMLTALESLVARACRVGPLRVATVEPGWADFAAAEQRPRLFSLIPVRADDGEAATRIAVELVLDGQADALMKGEIHTADFMRVIVAEHRMRTHRRMSHVALLESRALERVVFVSDGAVNVQPSLDEKREITQNAIDVARICGIDTPRVAILAAVETVSSEQIATIEAAAIAKMADRGQITGGIVDGPLALDDAISPRAVALKRIDSPVAGRADVLIAPDLVAANMLFKEIEYFSSASCADVVVGAIVPIVLTSRADDAATRVYSAALASLVANQRS
jgi:phosphate acetyltransferase